MSRLADHSRGRCGGDIGRSERADFVFHRFVHVPDAQVSVGLVEDGRSSDWLAASSLPQNILISCRVLPWIVGIRTQTLAVPPAGSHCSI